jgi:hypothetical protein
MHNRGVSRYRQAAANCQTIEKIAGAGRFNGRRATPEERKVRYVRHILRDGIEHEIPKSMALYLLDGHDNSGSILPRASGAFLFGPIGHLARVAGGIASKRGRSQMKGRSLFWFRVPDVESGLMSLKPAQLKCYLVVLRAIQRDRNRGLISVRQVAKRARLSVNSAACLDAPCR